MCKNTYILNRCNTAPARHSNGQYCSGRRKCTRGHAKSYIGIEATASYSLRLWTTLHLRLHRWLSVCSLKQYFSFSSPLYTPSLLSQHGPHAGEVKNVATAPAVEQRRKST